MSASAIDRAAALSRRRFLRAGMRTLSGAAALLVLGAAGARTSSLRAAPRSRTSVQSGGAVLDLVAGWNTAVWWGPTTDAAPALAALPSASVFGWDLASQTWRPFRPGTPAHQLLRLDHAAPLWIAMNDAFTWEQPPPAAVIPPDGTLPGGWSLVSWLGEDAPVWDVFGVDPAGEIRRALRWHPGSQQLVSYQPGRSAQELFAILHPGAVVWLETIVPGLVWNPVFGPLDGPLRSRRIVAGQATFFHPSLHGNPMFCGGVYDRLDPTIAAATTWPCGTRLRIWRGARFVDVVVRDTGLLPSNHVDVSEGAFLQLGVLAEGRLDVFIEAIPAPPIATTEFV